MSLECVQVADALPRELGPEKLSARVPGLAICGKDAVAQELLPFAVEGLALAVVRELRSQNRLDVFRVRCEDDTASHCSSRGQLVAVLNAACKGFGKKLLGHSHGPKRNRSIPEGASKNRR